MNIDRSLVKSQARQIIKGYVIQLFLVSIVVGILASFASVFSYSDSFYNSYINDAEDSSDYSDFFNFGSDNSNDQGSSSGGFDKGYFDDFTGSVALQSGALNLNKSAILDLISRALFIAQIIFVPLTVTLFGMYILFVRGRRFTVSQEFKYVFERLFDKNYFKKWLLCFLMDLIIALLLCLFIFPGIICYYKYYFAAAIMADNPNMSPTQAIRVSKKMTSGHKGELLALDLSFIGWFFLTIITCGIASIYTMPYYMTTKALYYENFRIRSLQEGRINAVDFMSEEEKTAYYQSQTTYYQPPHTDYGSGMGDDYYNNNNF